MFLTDYSKTMDCHKTKFTRVIVRLKNNKKQYKTNLMKARWKEGVRVATVA